MTCALCRWHLHSTADETKVICASPASPHRYTLVLRGATCPEWSEE